MITSYKDLPLGKYEQILEIAKDGRDEGDQNIDILAVLTDKTEAELLDLPLADFRDLMDKTHFLLYPCKETRVQGEYKVGDWTLVPVVSYKKVTAGQFIAFQQFQSLGDKYIADKLATLLVPKGHKYDDGYDLEDLTSAIRESMSVEEALSLCGFFLKSLAKSLNYTLASLEAEAIVARLTGRITREQRKAVSAWTNSVRALAGTASSTSSARLCVLLGTRLNG